MPAKQILTGLIGRGIGASRSPRMHEREAQAQGMRLSYQLFDFSSMKLPDDALSQMLGKLEEQGFAGTNITHPFKQSVIAHLDEISDEADRIGAVNTVAFRDARRFGYNTDVTGFSAGFRQALEDAPLDHVVQLGAGGAGSATAFALLALGAQRLTIYDVDTVKATALIDRLQRQFPGQSINECNAPGPAIDVANGIVNTTPIGMASHPGMPISANLLRSELWVADVIYFPLETELLAAARRAGCRVMDGSGMAVWQAVGAFEIFTGRPADAARMTDTFVSFDQ